MRELLNEIERKWALIEHNPSLYGYQIQRGTGWQPGMTEEEISAYEQAMGLKFPNELLEFFRLTRGADLPSMYRVGGETPRYQSVFWAYPDDLKEIRERMDWVKEDWPAILREIHIPGASLDSEPPLLPIYGHRYVLCNGDLEDSQVLSICESDAIYYGSSFSEYLRNEFL